MSNESGVFQLHSYEFSTKNKYQITHTSEGKLFGSITSDGKHIVYLNDTNGNEMGHFVAVPFSGGTPVDLTPELPEYSSFEVNSSNDGKFFGFVCSLEDKNMLYVNKFSQINQNYSHAFIYETKNALSNPIFAYDDSIIYFTETEIISNKSLNKLKIMELSSGKISICAYQADAMITPLAFLKEEGGHILGIREMGSWQKPVLINRNTYQYTSIIEENIEGDFIPIDISSSGRYLLCNHILRSQQKLVLYDFDSHTLHQIGPKNGSFDMYWKSACFNENEDGVKVRWHNASTPPTILDIDFKTNNYKPIFGKVDDSGKPLKLVHFPSSDGTEIYAWMGLPSMENKNIPFIIDLHGGPHGVSYDEFSPEAQTFLGEGFGYISVNYRGSISFGKEFQEKINGNPGHWEVEDAVATCNWIIANGFANANNIILHGWSWGGFIALLASAKYPKLWKAVIAGMSVTDCTMQYHDEPEYLKILDQKLFGGTPDKVPEIYIKSSPIDYVDSISAQILLIHGRNDMRCPPKQIEQFIKKMQDSGKNINIDWYESGHIGSYTNIPLRKKQMERILDFIRAKCEHPSP